MDAGHSLDHIPLPWRESSTPAQSRRADKEAEQARRMRVERKAAWRLVGSSDLRTSTLPDSPLVRHLKAAVASDINIASRWLRIVHAGEELNDNFSLPLGSDEQQETLVFMVCLVLPDFALLCAQPWFTRKSKARIRNQQAVRALAWQPGLLTHEEEDTPPSELQKKSFPVFVAGIRGLPSNYLRLDLRCPTPTLGQLRICLQQVLPEDSKAAVVFDSRKGQSNRQYLHRLDVRPGSVVTCRMDGVEESGLEGDVHGTCSPGATGDFFQHSAASATPSTARESSLSDSEDCIEILDEESSGPQENGRKRLIVSAQSGKIWSASSRRKLMSSGVKSSDLEKSALLSKPLAARQATVEEQQVWEASALDFTQECD